MKNILIFLWEHREALITFISALLIRRAEKPAVEKQTAKEIHEQLLLGKSLFEAFKKHLK